MAVYFRFSSVTKTQATISMGLHKSDLGLLLMKTCSKFLPLEELKDSFSKHASKKRQRGQTGRQKAKSSEQDCGGRKAINGRQKI